MWFRHLVLISLTLMILLPSLRLSFCFDLEDISETQEHV